MQSNPVKRIVVVGGGISGLTAAHRLVERGRETRAAVDVLLLEADARLGGIIHTHPRDGFLLEGGPDSFISEKPAAVELAKRIALTDRLIETNSDHRRSFVVRRKRLHSVPEGFQLIAPSRFWPFVQSDIFSWRGKARIGLDLLLPTRAGANGRDDESLASFVRRRLGREALERMAQPMVGGIYTADPEQLSLRATMPRFLEQEQEHGSIIRALRSGGRKQQHAERGTSGARYSLFLSFNDGMQILTDRLAQLLPPRTVRLHTKVESLRFNYQTKQWSVEIDDGKQIDADAVCLALPAYVAAKLLRGVDAPLAADLDAIPYASTATINLAYKRRDIPHPLDGFGFVVPFIERLATLACTFSSVKFPGRAPEGYALLRAFVGGWLQPEMFALDEDQMVEAVRRDLRTLLGVEGPPLFVHVEKWARSMPQYHLGHLERIERIRARLRVLPSLHLAGNAYAGTGLPDCIRSGETAADQMLDAGRGPEAGPGKTSSSA